LHSAHAWNVDRMLDALAPSLDYYRASFGPYQFDHVRIVEYPGYANFAQAFAGTKDLEIDYTVLSLAVPEKVRFRYRLDGVDSDWQDVGMRREAYYTNLKPGAYRFKVISADAAGRWNTRGAAIDVTIRAAFYQTGAFIALCVVVIAAIGFLIYSWHLRRVRIGLIQRFEERLDERTRIAHDLHDTLRQGFMSSSMQLHVAIVASYRDSRTPRAGEGECTDAPGDR